MMRSAIVLALLSSVLVLVQADVGNIESMLQNALTTSAPSLPAIVPAAGPNIAPLSAPAPTPAPVPTPAPFAAAPVPTPAPTPSPPTLGSLLGGNGNTGGSNAGGLLQGLLNSANAGSSSPTPASPSPAFGSNFGDDDDGWHPKVHVSEESREIVGGLVTAFMHKQQLLPGEKHCLENSVSELTGDIVGTGEDLIKGIKSMVHGGAGQPGFGQQQQQAAQGNVASAGIDGAIKLVQLVTLSTTLVKSCVQGDALALLKETARHFVNITYLEHRFMVSGVDVVKYLAKAIEDYEDRSYHSFGADIGNSLRKILLSKSTTGRTLPEGVPEEDIIRKTTEGIVSGFFVRGETLEITDTADPNVDINLDLHRCIAGNRPFFKEIFLAMWSAMAQMSMNKDQPAFQTNTNGQPKWTGELMVAMLQLPTALERCNLGMENEQMIGEAIKTIANLKFDFHMPQHHVDNLKRLSERMAHGVEEWTDWHFHEYGKEIGYMLREFVLMLYPQKYTVDPTGRLRRQFETSSISRISHTGFSAFVIAGMAFSVMLGFMAVRTMRSFQAAPTQEYDAELNENGELE